MYKQEREKLEFFWLENRNEIAQKLVKDALSSDQDYFCNIFLIAHLYLQ